jgi:hypothetical protein
LSDDSALIASLAAHVKWAKCEDRTAATAAARKAFADRFETLVDPDGALDPAERALRAENARKAHYRKLALKSAQVRRARKGGAAA